MIMLLAGGHHTLLDPMRLVLRSIASHLKWHNDCCAAITSQAKRHDVTHNRWFHSLPICSDLAKPLRVFHDLLFSTNIQRLPYRYQWFANQPTQKSLMITCHDRSFRQNAKQQFAASPSVFTARRAVAPSRHVGQMKSPVAC